MITPGGRLTADVLIEDGRFAVIEERVSALGVPVIDARGCHVIPGAIDAHVHFGVTSANERSADNPETGTLAACCGGVTTVGDFTEQAPNEGLLASIKRRLDSYGDAYCDYFLHANLTSVNLDVLREIFNLAHAGVTSIKVFLAYPGMRIDLSTLYAVVKLARSSSTLVMVHAEDQSRIDSATRSLIASGRTAARFFFESRPPEAEALAISDVGKIAAEVDAPIYIVHLSSAMGLNAVREARSLGARLIVETCPQYLFLSSGPATPLHAERLVCAPPLRLIADCEALRAAVAKGHIDVVASDHCPFTSAQKAKGRNDFRAIPGGLPGVETLLPLLYDAALRGAFSLERMVELVASAPARIFGLAHRKGAIAKGLDGDLIILDPEATTSIHAHMLHSRTDYSPWEGRFLKGAIRAVVLRGNVIVQRTINGAMEPIGGPCGSFIRTHKPLGSFEALSI